MQVGRYLRRTNIPNSIFLILLREFFHTKLKLVKPVVLSPLIYKKYTTRILEVSTGALTPVLTKFWLKHQISLFLLYLNSILNAVL